MHITKIELEDIKSHVDSKFEFSPGTIAITGRNGAGKTTLIEAVAWTLFDLLDYKKDDFVRRGAKKGSVRVTFESGIDEREYTVYRDTGTGYYVYDPRLKTRIADKKEEVTRFLWQHLGVEAGTDLETLFRRAIGVPQGTFTAIFLESPTERKKAFDKLLKVEEYRQGAEKLRETGRYIDNTVAGVREKIARAEGELQGFDRCRDEHAAAQADVRDLGGKLEKIEAEVAENTALIKKFDEIESKVREARSAVDKLSAELSRLELLSGQKDTEVVHARKAADAVRLATPDYERHVAALGRLAELDRERIERDKLKAETNSVETAILKVKADQKRFAEALENTLNANKAISGLQSKVLEQDRLEGEVAELRDRLSTAKAAASQVKSLSEKVQRLRDRYSANQAQIRDTEARSNNAGNIEEIQAVQDDVIKRLAVLQASLDRDEKFQQEIRGGLCPILSQKCLNLKEGETLEAFVSSQFTELRSEIAVLEVERTNLSVTLRASMEAAKYSRSLETLRSAAQEIKEEGERLKAEMASLEATAAAVESVAAALASAESRLAALDNPQAKIRMLETEASREMEFREKLSEIESNLERLESDRRILAEQLESYKDLDSQWAESCANRDSSADGHRTYISNEAAASLLGSKEEELLELQTQLERVRGELAVAEESLKKAAENYDPEAHAATKAALNQAEKLQVETRTTLTSVKRRADELSKELDRLAGVRTALQEEFREKERLEKIGELNSFIRETLKEAAPRVARNYVYHVSLEANQLFREICGDAEKSLKWKDDYGICVEEGGYERPFASLSGGEQMAAALSVRLALLKQLSDIRMAFFDEPTTNMDAERRENLALQISQIKHFDQLFVISHDDTFEGYVDNVISVVTEQAE